MKRTYFYYLQTALLAALTAGCAQNEVTETSPDAHVAVGFSVYTGMPTSRGNSLTTADIQKAGTGTGYGFGVCVYQTAAAYDPADTKSPFMDNTQVTYDTGNSAWGYSPLKFWPTNTDRLSFFAYAPYSATAGDLGITLKAGTDDADPGLEFELPEQADMTDLCLAQSQLDKTSADGKISLNLKHALSRVGMTIRTNVDLDNNPLVNLYITDISFVHTSKLAKTSTLNMRTGLWEATPAAYLPGTYALTDEDNGGILKKVQASGFADYTVKSVKVPYTAASPLTDDHYYFFMPVNGTAGTGADGDVQLSITYDIVTKAAAGSTAATVGTVTKTVNLAAGSFAQGKAYMYNLTINLNAVIVTATMDTWGSETPGNITVPA